MFAWVTPYVLVKLVGVACPIDTRRTLQLLGASGMFGHMLSESVKVVSPHRAVTTAVSGNPLLLLMIVLTLRRRPPVRRRLRIQIRFSRIIYVDHIAAAAAASTAASATTLAFDRRLTAHFIPPCPQGREDHAVLLVVLISDNLWWRLVEFFDVLHYFFPTICPKQTVATLQFMFVRMVAHCLHIPRLVAAVDARKYFHLIHTVRGTRKQLPTTNPEEGLRYRVLPSVSDPREVLTAFRKVSRRRAAPTTTTPTTTVSDGSAVRH